MEIHSISIVYKMAVEVEYLYMDAGFNIALFGC